MEEVWDSLHPALEPANSLRRSDALVPILWGLFVHVLCRGRIVESLRWVTQLMYAAEAYDDSDLLIVGHLAAVVAHFWLGHPIKTREHADRVLALYREEQQAAAIDQAETAAMYRIADRGEHVPHFGMGKRLRQPLLLGEPDLFLNSAQSLSSVFR